MGIKFYEGAVKYAAGDEPYDAGFGPNFNVKITMDDPHAPKAKDGDVAIYKKPGHEDTPFLRSLKVGDRVQLAYNDNGPKSYYSFVIPNSYTPSAQPQQQVTYQPAQPVAPPPQQQAPYQSHHNTWTPMTTDETVAFVSIANQNLQLLAQLWAGAEAMFPDVDQETRRAFTSTAFINASRTWRPGMVTAEPEPEYTEAEENFINAVRRADAKDKAGLVTAIIGYLSGHYSIAAEQVPAIMKSAEITSDDLHIDNADTWLACLYAVDTFSQSDPNAPIF